MKKVWLIVCAVMVIAAAGAFADKGDGFAIGGEGFYNFSGLSELPWGGGILMHLPNIPLMLQIGANSTPAIGVEVDYWLAHGLIAGPFTWYMGVGGYLTLYLDAPSNLEIGARVPFGIQLWPAGDNLEFFLEAAPGVGIQLADTQFDWHFRVALGLRYWI